MSQGTSLDKVIRLEAFNVYLSQFQISTFFQEVGPGLLVSNDQILKSAFFTPLCP